MDGASSVLERDIKDDIRQAKEHSDKTGLLRRDTLKRLIDLTHSQYPNLKVLAAQNIRFFFNDFPELEEEAINAVYDLCEDHTPKVRIEGYTAVTHLSKADNRLVRRNADVLLQLLQSDEPDEVEIVKKALGSHLDMDSKVTLSVLCDQIAPLDDNVDEDEQDMRDRLRKVVLRFLTEDARRAIVERYALPGTGAEEVLVDNLLMVIPKLGYKDVEIIVEEILLKLKVFKMPSPRGRALLNVLLSKVTELLQKATQLHDPALLRAAQPYLDLTGFAVVEKHMTPAIELLREYCSSISTKMNVQKFTKDDQQLVVCRLAETFAASTEQSSYSSNNDEPSLDALSAVVVNSCPFLLEALHLTATSPSRSLKACTILLQACLRRKQNATWTPPANLVSILTTVQTNVSREQSEDIYNLIRSLVPPPSTLGNTQDQSQDLSTTSRPQSTTNGKKFPSSLPDRPVALYPTRRMHIASSSRPRDHDQARVGASSFQSAPSTSVKHQLVPDVTRPAKRQKSSGDVDSESDTGPSLLSRLGTTYSSLPNPRTNSAPTVHPVTVGQRPRVADASEPLPPNGMLSIKGAARMGVRNAGNLNSWKPQLPQTPSFSLLERLENSNTNVEGGWVRKNNGR